MPTENTAIVSHTPGPWRIEDPMPASLSIMAPDRPGYGNEYRIVATVDTDVEVGILLQEAEANARLIAAAPDLLAASARLLDALAEMPHWPTTPHIADAIKMLEAAIALAEAPTSEPAS